MYPGVQVYYVVCKTDPDAASPKGEFVTVCDKRGPGLGACIKKGRHRGTATESITPRELLDMDEAGWSCKKVDMATDLEGKTREQMERLECHGVNF
jgi:hypothetical protein